MHDYGEHVQREECPRCQGAGYVDHTWHPLRWHVRAVLDYDSNKIWHVADIRPLVGHSDPQPALKDLIEDGFAKRVGRGYYQAMKREEPRQSRD